MKTQLLIQFFCLWAVLPFYGQVQKPILYEYARVDVTYYRRSQEKPAFNQLMVILDQGERIPRKTRRLENPNILRDQDGEIILFNSRMDAINYVAKLGWELVAVSDGGETTPWYYFRRPLPADD